MALLIESESERLAHGLSFSTSEMDEYQATKVAAWETAAAACQQAMQHLQQAKDAQRSSTLSACTPEQALSQYHLSVALEFKHQTQGTVEKAQKEVERRNELSSQRRYYYRGIGSQARTELWHERASRTKSIAQGLEQAATDSVEALEVALCSQSWDHKLVTKLHDDKLREMELEPEPESSLSDYDDHYDRGPKWQKSQRVEQMKSTQERLQASMAKIRRQEREDRFEMSKEKKKTRRSKQQALEVIDSDNINA